MSNTCAKRRQSHEANGVVVENGFDERFFDVSFQYMVRKLMHFVLLSRFCIFALQFLFNGFDFSTDAFKGLKLTDPKSLDRVILTAFRGFYRWDSIHMIHIAHHGYFMETSLAFLPIYPLLVRLITYCWASPLLLYEFISPMPALLVSAIGINFTCFIISFNLLYHIVEKITQSHKQAYIACILFAINPASVFFSAAYTEALYCLLTFAQLYFLICKPYNFFLRYLLAVLCFTLSYGVRSNGLLNGGYLIFYLFLEFSVEEYKKSGRFPALSVIILTAVLSFLGITFASIPMYFYGAYQKSVFCSNHPQPLHPELKTLARNINVPIIGEIGKFSWCNIPSSFIPAFYADIQTKYWGVGLFGYWQLSKIPCFIMAAPCFIITIAGVVMWKESCNSVAKFTRVMMSGGGLTAFVVHTSAIVAAGTFIYNIEVMTRMLFSCSPFPYLVIAQWMSDLTPKAQMSDLCQPFYLPFLAYFSIRGKIEFLVVAYFVGYAVLGTIAHSMFLPFT